MSGGWPRFQGSLLLGDAAREYGTDFGHIVNTTPRAALRAASVNDVIAAVRYARATGMRIVARGQGHCTRGQAQQDDAFVIDVADLDFIEEPVGATVRVGAGALWTDVVHATYARGLTPPVLTDYLALSVGGTLSVGGVGGQSFRHGFQVDNVVALEVVAGSGELVRCDASRESSLFDACRGGLGGFGIVVSATLALVPAPEHVRVRHLPYVGLDTFLGAQIALTRAGGVDYLVGNYLAPTRSAGIEAWQLSLECVEYLGSERDTTLDLDATGARLADAPPPEERSYLSYATRLAAMAEAWRASGSWKHRHPWIDVFVPAATAARVIESALVDLDASTLGDGYVMTYPLLARALRAPCPALPDADELFLFDVLPSVALGFPGALVRAEQRCQRIFEVAMESGATVYPIGYPYGTAVMGESAWTPYLANHRVDAEAVRERHDPGGVMAVQPRPRRG